MDLHYKKFIYNGSENLKPKRTEHFYSNGNKAITGTTNFLADTLKS